MHTWQHQPNSSMGEMYFFQDMETSHIKYSMRREKEYGDFWVIRDEKGEYIDHDQYRNDLFEQYDK